MFMLMSMMEEVRQTTATASREEKIFFLLCCGTSHGVDSIRSVCLVGYRWVGLEGGWD